MARGEVIVIDDNFGVRVTEIITAQDRRASEKRTSMRSCCVISPLSKLGAAVLLLAALAAR